jgi:thiol-disulfide isomerase/thioredoxin
MVLLHIDKNDEDVLKKLDGFLRDKKVFILIYMEGCGPCNATRPEWEKLENVLTKEFKNRDDIAIVDINTKLTDNLKYIKEQPKSFPTIRYYENNKYENYEDSNIENKDRTIDSFVNWIENKLDDKNISKLNQSEKSEQSGGYKSFRKRKARHLKTKKLLSRKWSRKYKKSINCRRPKGFSQRQYCKYGRKK